MSFMALAKKKISSQFLASYKLLPHLFSSTPTFKIHDYLVSSFGFSPAKAAAISKPISHLKSPEKPEAVRHFLEHHGFDESQKKTIVSWYPSILCSSVENTLAPNLRAIRNMGLFNSSLNQIILSGPQALQCSEAVPRINFWRDFVGGDEAALVKVFKCNRGLIGHDVNGIATKISLLQHHGISPDDIRKIVCMVRRLLIGSVSATDDMLKRVKELGFQPGSRMFLFGLHGLSGVSREMLQKKMEFFKSLGCSEDSFHSALRRTPTILHLSEENLRAKMDFLLGEIKCDISYIVTHPILLSCSLEKRLRPRHNVLSLLKSKNLTAEVKHFWNAIALTESKFVEKYILPHRDTLPGLYDECLATIAS